MNEQVSNLGSNVPRATLNHYTYRASPWYRMSRAFFNATAHALFKIQVVGQENIPPGNYIVVANHLSWIDPFLLMVTLPSEPRLYFIGAQQAINRGWKAWLMRKFDVMIPFERGANWVGRDVLEHPLQVLRAGALLGLYPEGKLGPREGELQPLQRGIGHIVLRGSYVILPVALSGVQELYLGKSIRIGIGRPFRVAAAGLDHHAAVESATAQVASAMRAVLPTYVEPNVTKKRMRFLTHLLK